MRPCEECKNRRESPGWPRFDPACRWCGAALIQRIKELPRPRPELTQRMQAALSEWVAMGHSEAEIRRLVAGPPALQPTGLDGHGESEHPKPTKRPSAARKR